MIHRQTEPSCLKKFAGDQDPRVSRKDNRPYSMEPLADANTQTPNWQNGMGFSQNSCIDGNQLGSFGRGPQNSENYNHYGQIFNPNFQRPSNKSSIGSFFQNAPEPSLRPSMDYWRNTDTYEAGFEHSFLPRNQQRPSKARDSLGKGQDPVEPKEKTPGKKGKKEVSGKATPFPGKVAEEPQAWNSDTLKRLSDSLGGHSANGPRHSSGSRAPPSPRRFTLNGESNETPVFVEKRGISPKPSTEQENCSPRPSLLIRSPILEGQVEREPVQTKGQLILEKLWQNRELAFVFVLCLCVFYLLSMVGLSRIFGFLSGDGINYSGL
jgi:hypothetical protein